MPRLRQILYVSTIAPGTTRADERQLVGLAKRNNRRSGLTGILASSETHFLQVLEGPFAAIDALLVKLAADRRHVDMRLLMDREVTLRAYPSWSMGYVHSPAFAEELAAFHAGTVMVDADRLLAKLEPDAFSGSGFGMSTSY